MASHLIRFRCAQCGKEHEARIYDGVDVSKEPQFRSKVMDASIFDFVCPSCGAVTGMLYPFLYHDPKNRFMVQLTDRSSESDPFTALFDSGNESDQAMKQVVEDMKSRYRFRTVATPNDLMEKIAVFEAGLDDRVLEVIKQGVMAADTQGTIVHLYFAPTDQGPVFLVEDADGFHRHFVLDLKLYEELSAGLQFSDSETRIDEAWARNYLKTEA